MVKGKVLETIKKYNLISKNDKIVVAVSGGPDSMCLLHILLTLRKEYNLELNVAHVNHMIRENAILDEEYVKDFCEKNNLNFFVKKVDVHELSKKDRIGIEEAGRKARYEFFNEVKEMTSSNKIAIAHNKNDKVETIFLNLIRGTGTYGLIGIEPKNGIYIRPLLEIERENIERYCDEFNLNPRIDESNFENIYNRNKIRNVIIPYIKKEFNPNIVNTVSRLSDIVQDEEKYFNKIVEKEYKKLVIEETNEYIKLNRKEFNDLDLIIRKKLVFYVINKLIGSTMGIEKIHVEDIIKLCSNNIGNKYLTPKKNIKVSLKNKQLYFEKNY